ATPAAFEPSIDYIVTKVPRFAFEKFPAADDRLTTQMKSVGEAMAIGRTFQESLQKALRSLETDLNGLEPVEFDNREVDEETLIRRELREAGPQRLLYVAEAFRRGFDFDEIHRLTRIDPWFLDQIGELVEIEQQLLDGGVAALDAERLLDIKRYGFSDARIAALTGVSERSLRELRKRLDVLPAYRRVDTCAADFATTPAYLYSTWGEHNEAEPTGGRKIMVLGGGPNRIGQGIEFDYCCVHAALAMRAMGHQTIMVNCNPETVSTDYDTSDRLYFEPLTLEDVLSIVDLEKPDGIIVQFGGQTPL